MTFLFLILLLVASRPVAALAEGEDAPSTLYVGSTLITSGYWTSSDGGTNWESPSGIPSSSYIYYDGSGTLMLNGATIKGDNNSVVSKGAGIYALCSNGQSVSLTIVLIGENTIEGNYGILVEAQQGDITGINASLIIKSESGSGSGSSSLKVTGSGNYGISVKSGTGDASLTIENASVAAKTTSAYSYYAGVYVQSSAYATNSPQLSLAVHGGSLTASGGARSDGIQFNVGSSSATATTSLTVSGNAIVDAKSGGISATDANVDDISDQIKVSSGTGNNGGIVFDGMEGTVYGDVTLKNDLVINDGETLTVPAGSSLNCNGNLTNNGTILVSGGTLSGGTALTTPNITTHPSDKTMTAGETATFSVAASNAKTYQWQQSTDNGQNWADISGANADSYTTAATTTDMNNYQYRCVVKSASGVGVISSAATLTVTANTEPTTYTISTAEQLRNFANAVNGGNTTANAVLTADIALTGGDWTPIGKDDDNMYNGTFDGQGHTISGLQCSVTSGDVAGLFGVIGSSGVVKNVGIADSDVAVSTTGQFAYAGGVCGYSEGTITNCWNSGSVSASSSSSDTTSAAYAGGVCGRNQGGTIRNCWNSGSVSASSSSSTAYAGGVCGDNTGSIDNCYWLDTACSTGVGVVRPTTNPDVESKTAGQFASGEVAWLLNQGQTEKPWRQGSNGMPVLEGNLPAGVTSYVPVRITIVMTDNTQKSYYSAKGSTFTEYPTGYAFVFKDGDTKTWINKGTQTYDADATIYAENMTLEKIPAKAPTCTEDGNIEYWYCAAFGKYFTDGNGVNEITAEDTVIPATGHNLTKTEAKAATCTVDGNIEYWTCSKCHKYFSDENATEEIKNVVIPATGHHYENGTCTVCGAEDPNYVEPEPDPEPEPEPTYFTFDFDEHPCDGVTLNSNLTAVEEGGTLYLYVEKEDETLYNYDNMRIYVKRGANAEWEELTEDPKRPGVYPITEIWSDLFIKVEGVEPNDPTAIGRVETLRIYASEGLLHVETPTRQRVTIVSMAGALIADGEQEGVRLYRDLNAGIYIVRVGDYATKVRVE